jgi:Zn-dependent peptidase ImmA (M78 family)
MSLSNLEIEKAAEKIRNDFKGNSYGILDIFEAAELLDFRVFRYPIGETAFLGMALVHKGEKLIFTNSSAILAREVFSAAHEIAHLILHLDEKTLPLIMDRNFNDESSAVEKEANYFAACLLMPAELLEKYIRLSLNKKPGNDLDGLDIARLQTAFNVSYDMTVTRLKELQIIDLMKYNALKAEKQEKTTTGLLKAINGNMELCSPANVKKAPAGFLEYVMFNYKEHLVPYESLKKVLDYFDVDANLFKEENTSEEDEGNLSEMLRRME